MHDASRARVVLLLLSVAFGAMSLPTCKGKKDESKREVEQAKALASQHYEEFKTQVGKLQTATSNLRARFKTLPEDLPGLQEIRSKLLSVEEVLGVEDARVRWLSGELNAAVATGKKEQLQKVSDTISVSIDHDANEVGKALLDLTHKLLPFEGIAAQRRAGPSK